VDLADRVDRADRADRVVGLVARALTEDFHVLPVADLVSIAVQAIPRTMRRHRLRKSLLGRVPRNNKPWTVSTTPGCGVVPALAWRSRDLIG
jgi:hypothetical protein